MKYLWPILIIVGALAITALLIALRPDPEVAEASPLAPPIRTITVSPEDVRLTVNAMGTVHARSEVTLTAEVSGRILRIADFFVTGGFIAEDAILVEIDPLPYAAALAEAQAALAGARLALEQERAQAEQARREWEDHGGRQPSPLLLREPQTAKAKADLEAAEAAVRLARRNLERTRVRAPYNGRIRERQSDLGQVVVANSTPLARVYAIDYVEVRLPLSQREASKLPLFETFNSGSIETIPARFTSRHGSTATVWEGAVVRTEGVVDPRTRTLTVVGEVGDPYRLTPANGDKTAPLRVGQFVEAELSGILLENAFRLPRAALVDDTTVRVVDADGRLHSRTVTVAHTTPDSAVITGGLEEGDRISLTPIDFFIEGMPVEALSAPHQSPPE